jgi:hypothetical protein
MLIFLLALRIVFFLSGNIFPVSPVNMTRPDGYITVTTFEDGFIAAGSGGRIDRISLSGEVLKSEIYKGEAFNCMFSHDRLVIAAGNNGTIMISSDGNTFRKTESGTAKNINSVAFFKGKIIAGADGGEINIAEVNGSGEKVSLPLRGNIVSLAAGASECYGVTDKGEIIHSADGFHWDIVDFNQVYSGYYKECSFRKVVLSETSILIAGVRIDGIPVLLFSDYGNVWAEKNLFYTDDNGVPGVLEDNPNDVIYDSQEDQFFLACSNGKLMKLNSCPQCNKMTILSHEDLTGIASNGNTLLIVGENYFIQSIVIR